MVSKPKAPTPPDPTVTANAQTSSNIDTAIANGYLNATNQNTPWGSVTYDKTGSQNVDGHDIPTFSSTTSLNPQYQGLLDSQAKIGQQALNTGGTLLNNVQGAISSPFSFSGLPSTVSNIPPPALGTSLNTSNLNNIPMSAADFTKQGQDTTDALMSRFNQDWDKQQAADDVKLANQGIGIGSEAYGANKDILNRARNDATSQALLAGNQEQNTLFNQSLASRGQLFGEDQAQGAFQNNALGQIFGMNMQNAGLQNQARQQGISEQQLSRNEPLNQLATLLGFSPGIQTPNAPNFGGNIAGTDVAGITQNSYADQQANYQQQMAQQNAMLGGLFGLGGAGILKYSDRRLKRDIRRIGKTDGDLPIYAYRYAWGGPMEIGVMAQDVEKTLPFAVHEIGGFKAVDYGRIA